MLRTSSHFFSYFKYLKKEKVNKDCQMYTLL